VVLVQSQTTAENKIGLGFLKECYDILPRKYKKNLKSLFVVEPTTWTKIILGLVRVFVSGKFWQKVTYCKNVEELMKSGAFPAGSLALPEFLTANAQR
jgi:prune family protein 2